MNQLIDRLRYALDLIKKGDFKALFKSLFSKLYSSKTSYGLKLDLRNELKKPKAFKEVSIRLYQDSDAPFFEDDHENIELIKQLERCFVGVTEDGEPCFRQWVMNASQNEKIHSFWGDTYPNLAPNQALMESAYTTPKLRGMGVMPLALYKIASLCKDEGIQEILTFAPYDNINSLRALSHVGFEPYCLTKEKNILFFKTVSHNELSKQMLEDYFDKTVPKRRRQK